MAERSINVLVGVKDQTGFGLKSAEGNIKSFQERFGAIGKTLGGSFGEESLEHVAKLFVGLHAVHGALDAIAGAAFLFRGETEKALEAFEKIPILGRFIIRPLAEVHEAITGAKEAMKALADETEKEKKLLESIAAINKIGVSSEQTTAEDIANKRAALQREIEDRTAQRRTDEKKAADFKKYGFDYARGIEEPTDTEKKAAEKNIQQIELLNAQLNALGEQQLRADKARDDKRFDEESKTRNLLANERQEANLKAANDLADELAGLAKNYEDRQTKLREILAENKALTLDAAAEDARIKMEPLKGEDIRLKAEIVRLKEHYAEQIKLAEDAGDQITAAALKTQETIKTELLTNKAVEKSLEAFFGPVEGKAAKDVREGKVGFKDERLLTGVTSNTAADKAEKHLSNIAELARKQFEKLQGVIDAIEEITNGQDNVTQVTIAQA